MSTQRPAVVIDNGTGYTKMGYAGNYEPNYIIPTIIATSAGKAQSNAGTSTGGSSSSFVTSSNKDESTMLDLDYHIGYDAQVPRHNYNIDYPIRHGLIDNWYALPVDNTDNFWLVFVVLSRLTHHRFETCVHYRDNMERYWSRCIYQYLNCDPEDHVSVTAMKPA